jgi:hypothetical protein
MGTLMPTWPTSISSWNLRAAAPLWVKMAVPLPLGLALMNSMASSMSRFGQAQHGAEDFLVVDAHAGLDAAEDGRADEVALS